MQLGEAGIGELVGVPDHLVDDVGLGRVQRAGLPAHVLGGQEAPIGQRTEEHDLVDQPGHRLEPKAGQRSEGGRDLRELRDPVAGQAQRVDTRAYRAGSRGMPTRDQGAEDGGPGRVLGGGVLDVGGRAARG